MQNQLKHLKQKKELKWKRMRHGCIGGFEGVNRKGLGPARHKSKSMHQPLSNTMALFVATSISRSSLSFQTLKRMPWTTPYADPISSFNTKPPLELNLSFIFTKSESTLKSRSSAFYNHTRNRDESKYGCVQESHSDKIRKGQNKTHKIEAPTRWLSGDCAGIEFLFLFPSALLLLCSFLLHEMNREGTCLWGIREGFEENWRVNVIIIMKIAVKLLYIGFSI